MSLPVFVRACVRASVCACACVCISMGFNADYDKWLSLYYVMLLNMYTCS